MIDLRRVVAATLLLGLWSIAPAAAQNQSNPPVDAAVYLALFDDADLRGVDRPSDEVYDLFVQITGDPELDGRIRAAAEARGYVRRPVADAELVRVDGRELQAPAAAAWSAMQAAARGDGISLVLTSAHRDLAAQQVLFRGRLGGGTSDAAIDRALRTSAPPGYSKHHSGYAIDVGDGSGNAAGFAATRAYRWLSEGDFARAKLFGFIPSYPVGGQQMGPDPEAWEFVWVGRGRVVCASAAATDLFCDVDGHPRAPDIAWMTERGITVGCAPGRFCVDDPVTRGEAASLLWRLHGSPAASTRAPFVDVFDTDVFRPAVDWLWGAGLVTGTSSSTFSPDDFLHPDEALVLLLRLQGRDELPAPLGLRPPSSAPAVAPVPVGDLGSQISRAEFASVLRLGVVG